ncbi:DMT family transporter [Georgenia halophila]|uniref:DMT family transporter n=1 Tax=Georgenia halophila TaxID=620889 RepID=UPI0031EC2CD8
MGARAVSERMVGQLAAAAALFLIGTSAPAAARLEDYPLLGGQALRFVVAGAVLLLWVRRLPDGPVRLSPGTMARTVLLALVGIAGFNVLLVAASHRADPALVGMMLGAAPLALAVLDPVLRRRRPGAFVVLGCALVTVGTALGAGFGTATALGVGLGLGALVCEVAFALLAVPLIDRIGTVRTTAYAVSAAALQLVLAALIVEGPGTYLHVPTPDELAGLAYMTVGIAVLANLLWYAALPRIGADHAALFYACTPVGALLAGLLLGESRPTTATMVGLCLVILGLLLGLGLDRAQRRRARVSSGD